MKTYRLTDMDTIKMQQVESLLHMLSPTAKQMDMLRVEQLVKDERLHIFVTEDSSEKLVGLLTLCVCPTLAKDKLWIEDVIVHEDYRNQGLGRALVREAVSFAKNHTTGSVIYLTSNPKRKAARALYASEGFEEYETGVFRMKI